MIYMHSRSSIWDPKENLPTDYARIFKFADFNKTKKRIMEEVQNYKNGVVIMFIFFIILIHIHY